MTYMTNKTYKTNLAKTGKTHGGYRNLKSYQTTTLVYDLTVEFCKTYMTYGSNQSYRTTDQMIQAARSGRHPIEHFLSPEGYVLASQERVYGARNITEDETYRSYLKDPESAANCIICLIHQANYLLDKQLSSLEESFIKDGGYSENLYKKRLAHRPEGSGPEGKKI